MIKWLLLQELEIFPFSSQVAVRKKVLRAVWRLAMRKRAIIHFGIHPGSICIVI